MTPKEIDQAIYNTAIKQGFNPIAAKFIIGQARFESADYTSFVFRLNNNTSGIKFIGQPHAQKGTLSPEGDYYAKFDTIQDAINDKIVRLYNINMRGVTPKQLKDSTSADDFARLLKQRGYYGNTAYGTPQAEKDIANYANGINAKIKKLGTFFFENKNKSLIIVASLIGLFLLIKYYKKK
jgi:hypothetical protein